MGDLNLYSVNWQDGMLVTQRHLKDQEKYFEELVAWHARGPDDFYGLVQKSPSEEALVMDVAVTGNHLRVEVRRCHGITPAGAIIEINESNQAGLSAETTLGESSVAVYVGVDPLSKRPAGEPDPSEDIPRLPYLAQEYSLHLGQPPNMPSSDYIQVANLTVTGNEVKRTDGYFPPCVTLGADEALSRQALDYRNRLESLLSLSSRAYAAVAKGGMLAGETTELQQAFKETVYSFGFQLSSSLDDFVVGRNASHPLFLVIFFKRMFRSLTTLLNFQPGLKDYLNERYFTKEIGSDIGSFMSEVDNFLMAEYKHLDLGSHVSAVNAILGVVQGILAFLAQVKKEQLGVQAVATDTVTYQGKTYRLVDYSGYRPELVGGLCYLLINIPSPQPVADMVVLINKDLFSESEWTSMQVRLGLNEARGLGETDPVTVDTTKFGNKVALRAQDLVKSPSVNQVNLIIRGTEDIARFDNLGKMDLIVYAV